MTLELRKRLAEVTGATNHILGDVAAFYDKGGLLVHTAVFVGARWGWGSGKWLHQVGWNYPVKLDNFQAMVDCDYGSLRLYR